MNKMKRYVRILALLLLAPLLAVPQVLAQEPASAPQELSQRCQAAINYIKTSQRPRDLRGRVDYLQTYQYIHQRLDTFARRLERNRQPGAADIRKTVEELQKEIDTFKQRYEAYDQAREELTNLRGCGSNTEVFVQRLDAARQRRTEVHDSTQRIYQLLEQTLQPQLDALQQALTAPVAREEAS